MVGVTRFVGVRVLLILLAALGLWAFIIGVAVILGKVVPQA